MIGPQAFFAALLAQGLAGPGPYVSPYTKTGQWFYYDTRFGRSSAVIESGGRITDVVQKATTSVGNLTGDTFWIQEGDRGLIGFDSGSTLQVPTPPQGAPLTLFFVMRAPWEVVSANTGGGIVLFSSDTGFILYSGFGGNSGVVKYYAGGSYIEGSTIGGADSIVFGISYFGSSAITFANADLDYVSGGSFGLQNLSIGDPRLQLELAMGYSRGMDETEIRYIISQIRTEHNLPFVL